MSLLRQPHTNLRVNIRVAMQSIAALCGSTSGTVALRSKILAGYAVLTAPRSCRCRWKASKHPIDCTVCYERHLYSCWHSQRQAKFNISIFLLNFSVIFPSTSVTRNLQNEIEHLLQQISKRLYLCCVLPFTITSALIYTRDHGQIKSEAAKSKK